MARVKARVRRIVRFECLSGRQRNTQTMSRNHYNGTRVSSDFKVPRVSLSTLDAATFFSEFIHKRCPVVLTSLPEDLAGLRTKWTNAYLRSSAGDALVEVEEREDTTTGFGKGNTQRMPFNAIIDALDAGSEKLYLTTQKLKLNAAGQPDIISPPLVQLRQKQPKDFPLRPRLLGNLIPMNLNIWMGNALSAGGSSSGLHHDYHDNLYVLLRGCKRFKLFSPNDAERMYTRGEIVYVHANGRVNYKGFETHADGSEVGSLEALERDEKKLAAERALAEAEARVERKEPGAKEALQKAEEELDGVLESFLDAEEDEFDDYDLCAEEEEVDDDDEGGGEGEVRPMKKSRLEDPAAVPLNFSRVSCEEDVAERFPEFAEAIPVECEIRSGEMLYLPAGWFHEVTSFSSDNDSAGKGHLAFNYWMHPPDGVSFEEPYKSPFWSKNWKLRHGSAGEL